MSYKVVELFSGCGGLALGLENAGFKTELLIEIDKHCVNTLKLNKPDWNIYHKDISNVTFSYYKNSIDVVAGGFPCQAFSEIGLGKGFNDTRGNLFYEFARCVKEVQPKIALIENVKGLLKHDNGKTLSTMVYVLDQLGYYCTWKILKSQYFDVPQKRERLFIIAVRNDLRINAVFPIEQPYVIPLKEALKDCPNSPGATYPAHKKAVLDLVPMGGHWRNLPTEVRKAYTGKIFYDTGGSTGMARRLSWDEPSLTLTCHPAQKLTERCHPDETRPLTVREYARIQTFPDNWQFTGSLMSQYKQIGNAVPVNLAYYMGKSLISMLDKISYQQCKHV